MRASSYGSQRAAGRAALAEAGAAHRDSLKGSVLAREAVYLLSLQCSGSHQARSTILSIYLRSFGAGAGGGGGGSPCDLLGNGGGFGGRRPRSSSSRSSRVSRVTMREANQAMCCRSDIVVLTRIGPALSRAPEQPLR